MSPDVDFTKLENLIGVLAKCDKAYADIQERRANKMLLEEYK